MYIILNGITNKVNQYFYGISLVKRKLINTSKLNPEVNSELF